MNYRHIYMLIIEHAKKETFLDLRPKNKSQKKNFPNQYFEFHHILPKSLFPCWSKRKSNIIALTAREHFFCHQLLTKIYPCSNMFYALWRLATDGQNKYCSSKLYQKIKESYKISETHHKHIKEAAQKLWSSNRSSEVRKKISNSIKNIYKNSPQVYANKKGHCYLSSETKSLMHDKSINYYTKPENRLYHSEAVKKAMAKIPREKLGAKKVKCIELNIVFESVSAAEKYLNYRSGKSHICEVCNGKGKTALGYHWEYC